MLEQQASEVFKQGTDLRRFADTKVDALRAELAAAVDGEANLRNTLAICNQRLAEQDMNLRNSLQQAELKYVMLQAEYTTCRDALNLTRVQLATQQPQYDESATQK